jgi:hypothetical protein
MNALEAGLRGKCPKRPESDFLSVSLAQMLAPAVSFFNPSKVFSGGIPRIGSLFPAALQQGVCHCSPALSTRHLGTCDASLGEPIVLTGTGGGRQGR